jgi:hypothetical protein
MSLSATYKAFLASPSPSALADHASLHYITTLTTINEAPAIIKHFTVQEKLLKLNEQKVLSTIESPDGGLCVDVQVTIEFIQGGGAYLPGLDDNFVSDRLVTFPMVRGSDRGIPRSAMDESTALFMRLTRACRSISSASTPGRSPRSASIGTRVPFSSRSRSLAHARATGPFVTARTSSA